MLRRTAIGLVLALLVVLPATAQEYEKGMAATKRGDYATALREFRPLAATGHVGAQYLLAKMYQYGRGVPQDHAEAMKWYLKMAERGSVGQGSTEIPNTPRHDCQYFFGNEAQFWLGHMYSKGQGAARDYVLAYMWFSLSAARGDEMSIKQRDIVARDMTPAQIAEGQKLAREWRAKHPKKK